MDILNATVGNYPSRIFATTKIILLLINTSMNIIINN